MGSQYLPTQKELAAKERRTKILIKYKIETPTVRESALKLANETVTKCSTFPRVYAQDLAGPLMSYRQKILDQKIIINGKCFDPIHKIHLMFGISDNRTIFEDFLRVIYLFFFYTAFSVFLAYHFIDWDKQMTNAFSGNVLAVVPSEKQGPTPWHMLKRDDTKVDVDQEKIYYEKLQNLRPRNFFQNKLKSLHCENSCPAGGSSISFDTKRVAPPIALGVYCASVVVYTLLVIMMRGSEEVEKTYTAYQAFHYTMGVETKDVITGNFGDYVLAVANIITMCSLTMTVPNLLLILLEEPSRRRIIGEPNGYDLYLVERKEIQKRLDLESKIFFRQNNGELLKS
ncbi:unnamed protein product [Caenorhabditis auriculariae]|uniref:Uncharacterized protein n=1 Tax=Caenorhabditis auriculariae TaxID=2777116 RepID=A0A8S1H200_9PELO|nr:unnamed protein product [Caenorhabditis auriculariae]